MFKTVFFVLISLYFLNCVELDSKFAKGKASSFGNDDTKPKRKFTQEWQELEEDEAIPAGLHVRINLSTGKKEAKLLDDSPEAEKTSLAIVEQPEDSTPNENVQHNKDLKERLKNIPEELITPSPEEIEDIKKKFRPYEELKKEFEHLKMSVKTDLEVMNELFASYEKIMEKKKESAMEELGNLNILSPLEASHLNILTDLEYMVHQVDNAKEFVSSGGLTLIVYPSLNSSSAGIRTEAARLLGSAVQNNDVSQIKALESGAVGTLLRVLALDSASSVKSATLYALSCLVRRFPLAQRQFVEEGGVTVLTSLFDGESGEQLKLQVKVVTFIDDLLVERQDAKTTQLETLSLNETSFERVQASERLRQYKMVDLDSILQEQHWCQHMVKLLKRDLHSKSELEVVNPAMNENSMALPDFDSVEKLTRAMLSLVDPCRKHFLVDPQVEKLLLRLEQWVKTLSLTEEEGDGYFTSLAGQVRLLISKLGVPKTSHIATEML